MNSVWEGCEVGRLVGVAKGFLGPGSVVWVRGRVNLVVADLPGGRRLFVGVVANADP
jgi:hypothetical protein